MKLKIKDLSAWILLLALILCLWAQGSARFAQAGGSEKDTAIVESSDFVTVRIVRDESSPEYVVLELKIDRGFHINANPSTNPYLIPTEVKHTSSQIVAVSYPQAEEFKSDFSEEVLDVYSNVIEILIELRAQRGVRPIPIQLRYQACSQSACFAPSLEELKI